MWKQKKQSFNDIYPHRPKSSTRTSYLPVFLLTLIITIYLLYPYLRPTNTRFVIIVATNAGGGVLGWKGPQEWAVEKTSIKNKQDYASKQSYILAMKDLTPRKKYAHEWRESWEKIDVIREVMREHPKAEWFWWLDVSTYIMEPHVSLDKHIFSDLPGNTFRNLSMGYNPLNFTEIPRTTYDGAINMIIPQDCGGFNLGSFFIRRSEWTERLLDLWWDPVMYEQRHMQWEHKEQDAFEELYASQSWIRSHVAFTGNRKINAYPPGACAEKSTDKSLFYGGRDFVVNMAGCQYGRNCYDEMRYYKDLSRQLNAWWRIF